MKDTLTLGRIAGIRVGLNWSWLVVFALIVWTLSASVFPATDPGLGRGSYVAMAVVAALLFFVSLLLHELGHAIQARREGMEIDGITLWMFGGVARFKRSFPSAGAELRIAVAGPLVTAALGGAFVAFALLTRFSSPIDGVAAWLGYVNLLLLVFNLIPALPLDGGRILRALLWWSRGDYASATRVAVAVARGAAYVMLAGGLALVVFRGALAGVWFALIGWFLLAAVAGEARYAAARRALAGLTVGDLMAQLSVTAQPDETLARLADEADAVERRSVYPVVDGGRFVGLLPGSAIDAVPREERARRRVRDAMVPSGEARSLDESETAIDALAELGETPLHGVAVLAGERVVGILSLADVEQALGPDGEAAASPSRTARVLPQRFRRARP